MAELLSKRRIDDEVAELLLEEGQEIVKEGIEARSHLAGVAFRNLEVQKTPEVIFRPYLDHEGNPVQND